MSATATGHFLSPVPDGRGPQEPVTAPTEGAAPRATVLAALPEPTSSFGAAAADGWLYVFGGHVSPTHAYSTAAVSACVRHQCFSNAVSGDGRRYKTVLKRDARVSAGARGLNTNSVARNTAIKSIPNLYAVISYSAGRRNRIDRIAGNRK